MSLRVHGPDSVTKFPGPRVTPSKWVCVRVTLTKRRPHSLPQVFIASHLTEEFGILIFSFTYLFHKRIYPVFTELKPDTFFFSETGSYGTFQRATTNKH